MKIIQLIKKGTVWQEIFQLFVSVAPVTGGWSYWAGRAAFLPLFCPGGPPMCLPRPLLGTKSDL